MIAVISEDDHRVQDIIHRAIETLKSLLKLRKNRTSITLLGMLSNARPPRPDLYTKPGRAMVIQPS